MKLFDKIKGAFAPGNKDTAENKEYSEILDAATAEIEKKGGYYWNLDVYSFDVFTNTISQWTDKEKVRFIGALAEQTVQYNKKEFTGSINTNAAAQRRDTLRYEFVRQLFKRSVVLEDEDINGLLVVFSKKGHYGYWLLESWPVAMMLRQVERQNKKKELSREVITSLEKFKSVLNSTDTTPNEKNKAKVISLIESLIFGGSSGAETVMPVYFAGEDDLTSYANSKIDELPKEEKEIWFQLLAKAQKVSGSKPSVKYLEESKNLFKTLGPDKFKKLLNDLFSFVIQLKDKETIQEYTSQGTVYQNTTLVFLTGPNIDMLKGLVWMCSHFHDTQTLHTIVALAERCYKKIPGVGAAAAAIGNACVFVLYKSKGLDGIGLLSRLKLKVKQSSTQNLIDKYLQQAADEQGISVYEIEDLAVDDYGLIDGKLEQQLGDFTAIVTVTGVGKTHTVWINEEGKEQKSAPAAVKEKFAAKLKKLNATTKNIEAALTTQRDRIDRLLRVTKEMTWEHFEKYYVSHGLMGFLTKKITWNFETGKNKQQVIFLDGNWVTNKNEKVTPTAETIVSLWHPVTTSVKEISDWREFLITNKIQQPLKQVFREVYIITDAELNTRTYSNRMAAHLLRQHQFNSLAKTRGWKYALQGAWDGNESDATLPLPEYNLRAEYWIQEVNDDTQMAASGIWNYISTDQVRFVNPETNAPVELVNVPKVIFSEVMRDVDLFVGVASVGNDPTWQDSGGMPLYRDYWQSYSFGDLTEIAKSRKELLTRLLPRLKINKVAEIKDRFLVVKGKLRTYKIHIGSTNILMEPNDEYLCIVPDRKQGPTTDNLFLPFEGDAGLSIIISKALLLADDDKITDSSITGQINRN